jgi:2-polyprenyl-3-methyl-5-hydroxy-6-metoxy-1,4-benzoquinol methylase
MTASTDPTPFAYDAVRYPTRAQSQVHPERLAALGTLYGLETAPPDRCSILELGCGDAGNLAPIAAAFPGTRCVGVDLSGAAIERGREFVQRCGITNLELRQADLAGEAIVEGQFDYILCHGLYAWVPPGVRGGILRQCRDRLAPNGLAMVSYNALPGGCVRQVVRDMLRWHIRDLASPSEQVEEARALAKFLTAVTTDTDDIGRALRSGFQAALAKDHGFLYHDELAEHYGPVYFHEFMGAAGRHGLQFVADADPGELAWLNLPKETGQILEALTDDRVERQQYLDFMVGRCFHNTVLCHAGRAVATTPQLDRLHHCWFSAQGRVATPEQVAEPGAVVVFERPDGPRLETDFLPGKLALAFLLANTPRRTAYPDLARQVEGQLARQGAMDAWTSQTPALLAKFLLEACIPKIALFHGAAPEVAVTPGERPVAFAVARVQAQAGGSVTSVYHHALGLEDRWVRELVARADGSRTRAELITELHQLAGQGDPADWTSWPAAARDFDAALNKIAQLGLLVS